CGSRGRRSTRSSGAWTATSSGCWPPMATPPPSAPPWWASPSGRSAATRPSCFRRPSRAAARAAVERVAAQVGEAAAVVGFVEPTHAGPANAAALCHRGRVLGVYRKVLLPNYGVFDEERYFVPGAEVLLASFGRVEVAVTICEDLWFPWGPMATAGAAGGEGGGSLNASPARTARGRGVVDPHPRPLPPGEGRAAAADAGHQGGRPRRPPVLRRPG